MSDKKFDLVISDGEVLVSNPNNPSDLERSKIDIGVKDGKILELAPNLTEQGEQVFSASGMTVLPGIIDSQVHFRDPGLTHKEDFGTGTLSAVQGGVTAVFDMPNTKPNTSTQKRFKEKLDEITPKAYCDFGIFVGATSDNPPNLGELENLPGCCGVKIFMGSSTGDLLVANDDDLLNVLKSGKRTVAVHCEDESILLERKHIAEEKAHSSAHPEWRNVDSAFNATKRIVSLAKQAGRRIHTLHITTAEELEFLKENKDVLTVECLPQHLYFSSPECYEELGSLAQMNPPIREARHREALWKAMDEGVIDVVGSDHAPHTLEEKKKTYPQCPSGLPGVQTIVPLMLHFVNQGKMTLEKFVQLMSTTPAKLYKAKGKGGIFEGQDADFTIVDLNREQTITHSWIASKCGWTPYDGLTVKGWPTGTIIRGQIVMKDGKILNEKIGQPIQFL